MKKRIKTPGENLTASNKTCPNCNTLMFVSSYDKDTYICVLCVYCVVGEE